MTLQCLRLLLSIAVVNTVTKRNVEKGLFQLITMLYSEGVSGQEL